jgi:hypothetical protein
VYFDWHVEVLSLDQVATLVMPDFKKNYLMSGKGLIVKNKVKV